MDDPVTGSLRGRSVVVTRSSRQNEALSRMLVERGATVVEMPLIGIVEPEDGGAARDGALATVGDFDWLVVTSPNGAERVAAFLGDRPRPRVAVVGAATESALGRRADLVPDRALADALVEGFPTGSGNVMVVQGELADDSLTEGLAAKGWSVTKVVAYRTIAVEPSERSRADALACDALLLASGSAAAAWCRFMGAVTPEVVVAIGPSTAQVATDLGITVTAVAHTHTLEGMVGALEDAFGRD